MDNRLVTVSKMGHLEFCEGMNRQCCRWATVRQTGRSGNRKTCLVDQVHHEDALYSRHGPPRPAEKRPERSLLSNWLTAISDPWKRQASRDDWML